MQPIFVLLFVLALTSISGRAYAQEYEESALIWRGFHQRWTYNHRLARLGSAVESPTTTGKLTQGKVIHTAASGKGADRADFTDFFSAVAANGVRFRSGSVTLTLEGKEGEERSAEQSVSLTADSLIRNQKDYLVVLNGFDIYSEQKADKLLKYSIGVSDGFYDPAEKNIKFDVYAALNVDCNSFECNLFRKTYKYTVQINYLLVAGDDAYKARKATLNRKYYWDKRIELDENAPRQVFKGDSTKTYTAGLAAFKAISVELDEPHWFVEWHTALEPCKYNAKTGTFSVSPDVFFKQWRRRMKRYSYSRKHSRWAKRKAGLAILSTQLAFIQFKDGCVKNYERRGTIRWEGKNQSVLQPASLAPDDIPFDKNCIVK